MTDRTVQLAYPYQGDDGTQHDRDAVVTLDDAEASRLLHEGLARVPDETTSTVVTKKKG